MASRSEQNIFGRRTLFASTFCVTMLGVLVVRLWYLQCVYGAYFRDLSENNRIRTIRTVPPRGTIYDREEKVLVRNRPAFDVALMLEDTPNVNETLSRLAEITGREVVQLQKQFQARARGRHFEPVVVMSDVSREELARVKVNGYRLPGVIITTVPARAYPANSLAAQVLGYAREISKSQLEALAGQNYKNGDLIGQSGLEKQWEESLRGRSGYVQVEVDARGNRRGELGISDDQIGDELYLTLDMDMQAAAEQALAGKRGAVVALDPRSGQLLVLASAPSFDANIFSGKMDAHEWEKVATDRQKPLSNRAISSKYPPGSTFKLFMAVAGLASGKITPATEVNCPGYYMFAGRPYRCHKHSGHGIVNLQKAITVSCNAYFYQLGQTLQIGGIEKYVGMFGFGVPTGLAIPGEDPGILPSDTWKREVVGEKWYPGDTMPVAIGQGYMNVTPMQMANGMAAIANGGTLYQPYLVRKIVNPKTGEVKEFQPKVLKKIDLAPSVLETVRRFSVDVVNDPRGTGKRAALPGILVAGKTGTAQMGALGKENLGEYFKDHAWFVSFAPADNPTIAMAVIVENSGHGGEFAAPVSRQVMEVYFRKLGMLPPPEAVAPATPGASAEEPLVEEEGGFEEPDAEAAPVQASSAHPVEG